MDGQVLKNETALLLCRAMDSLWSRNMVSLLSYSLTHSHLGINQGSCQSTWLIKFGVQRIGHCTANTDIWILVSVCSLA